ncbi:MAG: N-acetylmuramoyl-L-alanine amidase, partial [Pseudomonadota bacterium]|nr:N-acetylmuramoyl-L-alanine amidase [Pseudomonadota bacterium]
DRIHKARRAQADLFISIHADAARNRKAQGASVYVLSPNGASSEHARWLAKQENDADLIGGVSLDDKDGLLRSVLLDLSQTATIEASADVASSLLKELGAVGRVHSTKVEQAGFVVLKSPDIPSVLVETAFISNTREEKRLKTRAYQKQVATAILKGVKRYFRQHAPASARTASAPSKDDTHVIQRGETLSTIAHRYRVDVGRLRKVNALSGDSIRTGQVLRIPLSGS